MKFTALDSLDTLDYTRFDSLDLAKPALDSVFYTVLKDEGRKEGVEQRVSFAASYFEIEV